MSGGTKTYAGDVTAPEAFELLKARADAVLVDVRTRAEWSYVGLPDLSSMGKRPLLVEWQSFPSGAVNEGFLEALSSELSRSGTPRDAPLVFLCRSGARSLAAAEAMTRHGFTDCLNIAGGFEGPLDSARHRGVQDGWKARDLPWTQS